MNVSMMSLDAIIPYDKNPRRNASAIGPVAASLKAYGFRRPIVVDAGMVIIVGHTRYLAAKRLGLKEVPVHVATDLTPEQVRAYRIADNKTGEIAEWDDKLLAGELRSLLERDVDLVPVGFNENELNRLLASPPQDGLCDPDSLPDLASVVPRAKPGDLWRCGRHFVLVGNACEAADVVRVTDKLKPAIMICEPDLEANYEAAFSRSPANVAYVWHTPFATAKVGAALKKSLHDVRSQLILEDAGVALHGCDYSRSHLCCLYAVKRGCAARWGGDRKQSTIWSFPGSIACGGDLASLYGIPVRRSSLVLERSLLNHGGEGDVAYFPFAGTGPGLIAAERTHRTAACIERNPVLVDVILARWEAFSGEKAKCV